MGSRVRWTGGIALVALISTSFLSSPAAAADASDLDRTFGGDGIVSTDLNWVETAWGLAIDEENKIVVAGLATSEATAGDASGRFAVARYLPSGQLDASFSADGRVLTEVGDGDYSEAREVLLVEDGKIVVVGTAEDASGNDVFAAVRYNYQGTLDTTFSGDGMVTIPFAQAAGHPDADARARGAALSPSGKIVIAGGVAVPETDGTDDVNLAVARLNANGSLDTTFSGDGTHSTRIFDESLDMLEDVTVQADEKIVAGGWSESPGDQPQTGLVWRLLENGQNDMSFGTEKTSITLINYAPGHDAGTAIELQSDGKILLVGRGDFEDEFGVDFTIFRFLTNGTFDESFGTSGGNFVDFGNRHDGAYGVTVQGDGKIVVTGESRDPSNPARIDFALARFTPDGAYDQTFSGGGKTYPVSPDSSDGGRAVAIDELGNIVASGFTTPLNGHPSRDFAVIRVLAEETDSSTSLTLNVRKTSVRRGGRVIKKLVASGTLQPNHTGFNMIVSLFKMKNGRFQKVGQSKTPSLNAASAYKASFSRPSGGVAR